MSKQNISPTTANLSLPTKEIIFRTFVIPWMQSHELKGVVAFEAAKYIPFPLDQLAYAFYPITINEGGTRRIRIILTAIKKNILDSYTAVLEQSNLAVQAIEPGFLSLIRTLNINAVLQTNQTVAILQKRNAVGEIIVCSHGIPQFVREFPLAQSGAAPNAGSSEWMTRLINEIRISLDYFNRQDNQIRVEQILLLTSSLSEDISQNLEADLGVPIKAASLQSILNNNRINEIDYMNAFGAALIDAVETPVSFDFSRVKKPMSKSKMASTIKKFGNTRSVAITFAVCLFFLLLTWIVSKGLVAGPQTEIASLKQQLGLYEEADTAKLKETTATLKTKLDALKDLHTQSNISSFLTSISPLLPKGVWLNDMEIYETPSKQNAKNVSMALDLSGYAYSDNNNKEFQLVTKFHESIRASENFSKIFESITLDDVKAQKLGDYNVVFFRVVCRNK